MKSRAIARFGATLLLILSLAASAFAQAPETVYITKTGSKYHLADCSSLKKSSIPMPLNQAAAKYQPCKICKPAVPAAKSGTSKTTAIPLTSRSTLKAAPATQTVDSGRYQATTKNGTQCTRKAKSGEQVLLTPSALNSATDSCLAISIRVGPLGTTNSGPVLRGGPC